ncbi:transcription termination factor 1 [Candoia aspera]|uniref:transcription termination factor 1 n=1 Tax=Candoia aspera TaxID=51853 RepID=UPI002FD7D3AC
MNRKSALLAEDAQQSGFAKKKKSRKRSREQLEQPAVLWEPSDQPPLSCQDTEDSEAGRKKSKKKKKTRTETSDSQVAYSWATAESELNCETEISNSVPKKKKKKKHRLNKHGSDDELCSQPTPKKPSKVCQKEDVENGGGVYDNMSSHKKKKKKKKRMEDVCVPVGPVEETTEATSSNREDQMELSDTVDSQMGLFASSPLSLSEMLQVQEEEDAQEGNRSPTFDDSDVTDVDLVMEGTSAGDHEEMQPGSPPELPTLEVNTRLDQSPTSAPAGSRHPSSSEHSPSEAHSPDEDESLELSLMDTEQLEAVTKELEEFIPHVRTLSDLAIKRLAKRDLARFRDFKRKGVPVKFGVFSKAENDLLKKNVEAFLEESGIETAEQLLFTHRFPEDQAEIKKLKCQYLFCESIAQGIPRPWRLVYYRARKMFDPQNYNGRYSKKEKKQLHKYHAMYGNNWKIISENMNRSPHSIALKYTQMIEDPNFGPWSKEETRRLVQTLKDMLRTKVTGLDSALEKGNANEAVILLRENLYKDISWMKVAAKVETRSWRQCKRKWTSIITKKMVGKARFHGLNNLQFKVDLIERLYEQNVADTNEIDWERIANAIGNAPPDYVQGRYYRLKTTHVPFWNEKSFPEVIDYLFEVTLPSLKETVEQLSKKQRSRNKDRNWKKSFQFNDIFRDELEDEESEDDSDEEVGEASHVDG